MKKNFVFLMVSSFIFLLCGITQAGIKQDVTTHDGLAGNAEDAVGIHSAALTSDPVVNIGGNGSYDSLELNINEALHLSISVNAGDHENEGADWWLLQQTPDGNLYYFDVETLSMMEGYAPTLQAGLVSFADTQVLSLSDLEKGTHAFYFGVDFPINGVLDIGSLYYDYLRVSVLDNNDTYTNSLGQTFKLIPAGTFTMGSPSSEPGRDSDETQHQVTLTQPFYMQQTEVTQAQWEAVMGTNPSEFFECPTCPVETVSWNDVQEFISRMNERGEGIYSLPTEAQWEYAARAGTTTAFYNGGITVTGCSYDPNLNAIGWYCYNDEGWPGSVGQKVPNAWGLSDMSGNVNEWCSDWYGSYPLSAVTDPTGPSSGSYPVLRGGSWYNYARDCRSANRSTGYPSTRDFGIGFRLLRRP